MKQQKLILLLGGNEGEVRLTFRQCLLKIEAQIGRVESCSSIYKTAAWGPIPQADFLNQIFIVKSHFSPQLCLKKLLQIEAQLGRQRTVKYGPRTIDLDVLFYNNDIIRHKNLTVPHPEIQNRRFVLTPLNELMPNYVHPVLKSSIGNLLLNCKDTLTVEKV